MFTALLVFSWSFLTKPPRVGTLNVHLIDEETEVQRCLVTCPVCYPWHNALIWEAAVKHLLCTGPEPGGLLESDPAAHSRVLSQMAGVSQLYLGTVTI